MSDEEKTGPTVWRPEWRRPAPRRGEKGEVARARKVVLQRLPPDSELLREALGTLRAVHLDTGAAEASRVGAAKAIIEHLSGRKQSEPQGEDLTDAECDEFEQMLRERRERRTA